MEILHIRSTEDNVLKDVVVGGNLFRWVATTTFSSIGLDCRQEDRYVGAKRKRRRVEWIRKSAKTRYEKAAFNLAPPNISALGELHSPIYLAPRPRSSRWG
jgi:hypothetical protein